jgi:hypothetical protein
MYATTPYSCFFFLSSFCSQVLCCNHKRCNNESRAGKSFLSWVLLPLQYAGAGRRKVTMRREDDRRRAMLFSLDKRERERERERERQHLQKLCLYSPCICLPGRRIGCCSVLACCLQAVYFSGKKEQNLTKSESLILQQQ